MKVLKSQKKFETRTENGQLQLEEYNLKDARKNHKQALKAAEDVKDELGLSCGLEPMSDFTTLVTFNFPSLISAANSLVLNMKQPALVKENVLPVSSHNLPTDNNVAPHFSFSITSFNV